LIGSAVIDYLVSEPLSFFLLWYLFGPCSRVPFQPRYLFVVKFYEPF